MAVSSPKLEWQRALTTLSALALAVTLVTALYWARSIFIPVALAVFFTFVLSPVVYWLQKRGLGRLPAVVGSVAVAVLLAAAVGGLIAWQLGGLFDALPAQSEAIVKKLNQAKAQMFGDGESQFGNAINNITAVFVPPAKKDKEVQYVVAQPQGGNWYAEVSGYVSPALELVGQAAFGFILSVFMLLKKEDLRNRLIRLSGSSQLTTTTKAVDDASRRISRYLLMQLMLNSGFGVVITVGLLLMGVKYALLWGALASLMRYIPYLGTWLGLLPPVFINLATSDGWGLPLGIVALYGGLEALCNNVLEPWLYGTSMGLSEVAQLIAAAFWAFLWGPVGLILSGPLTVCLLVLGKYVPRFEFLDVLLGDEPALSPDVRVYQRLAARDQDEAEQVAHEELKKSSLEAVFDTVLIPALSYARRDVEQQTLDRDGLAWLLRDAREIIVELAESQLPPAEPPPTDDPPVRILAVPARDDTDEVTLEMLRGLMADGRWEVNVLADETLGSEVLAKVQEFAPAAIVIGSLPPGGLAHTRYLCKRLRRHFPDAKLMVGRWGLADAETEEARGQLTAAGAEFVATSLAEMKQHLAGWATVFTAPAEIGAAANGKSRVGTRTA